MTGLFRIWSVLLGLLSPLGACAAASGPEEGLATVWRLDDFRK